MESPPHQQRAIIDYFLSQSPAGTLVHHAEKVASETIYGFRHDVWDVQASDGRWWVITNPTNLYPQETVPTPSMDHALAHHIGVVARMLARQHLAAPVDGPPRELAPQSMRKFEQAGDALDRAQEAEDFQAVGMRLRECLIAFAQETSGEVTVPEGTEPPKRSDVKGWAELLVATVAPGSRSAQKRSYLRTMARETWDLVAWLTHAANATRADADMARDATSHLLEVFTLALIRVKRGEPARCPDCGSYRIVPAHRAEVEEATVEEYLLCEECGWESDASPVRPNLRD
jgi:predicted RNA-binding Zn-ribbon protein involved in translation (DUF1610 family)